MPAHGKRLRDCVECGGLIQAIPDTIIKTIQFWATFVVEAPEGTPSLLRSTGCHQVSIPTDKSAQSVFLDMRSTIRRMQQEAIKNNEPHAPLWGRSEEHARRTSLIISSLDCNHPSAAHITRDHAIYACTLEMYLKTEFIREVKWEISDSDQERASKSIHRMIDKSGSSGVMHRDIWRVARHMSPRQRGDIIHSLLDSEYIVRLKTPRSWRYFCLQYAPKGAIK